MISCNIKGKYEITYVQLFQQKLWRKLGEILTFRKIGPHFFPEWHITVENYTSPFHPNTLQPLFVPKSGCVVGAPQNMVHCRAPVREARL